MLGVHSLTPTKLYVGTTTVQQKPTIRRVISGENEPRPSTKDPLPTHQPDASHDTTPTSTSNFMAVARGAPTRVTPSKEAGPSPQEPPRRLAGDQSTGNSEQQTASHVSPVVDLPETAMTAGPSGSMSHRPASLRDPDISDRGMVPTRPDESHANAISYRRDPETVIAYLVPLPEPTVQGKALQVPPQYFLYAPPPPHLIKPAQGSEGYAVRLTRHWQQSVRRAKINAHNGKKVSWKGTRSKMIRACVWGLNKLKYDDVAFLARIHPKTVTHLILIHPSDLSAQQTPEEILSSFRAQIFESKKRAKRNSIISAALFLPALAIDTAAVFFGGLAEIDGIWMLVSITAYRTARLITQKMGPDPKTLEISQEKLIEEAQKLHPQQEKEESDDESETGAIRRSVDALRRGVGSIKHRISQKGGRNRRKSESGDRVSTDTSRPQTRASQGFVGGELEDHAEETSAAEVGTTSDIGVASNAAVRSNDTGEELSGMLEHSVEEEIPGTTSRPSGGIFQDDTTGDAISTESGDGSAINSKGQNFQLTFYPSPAMDILDRYMQERCHTRNGQAFSGTTVPPTEGEVLAVMGWRPERRQHQTAEQQQEDEEWQAREIEDDLRLIAAKAAKSWDKACHKQARKSRRPLNAGSASKVGFPNRVRFRGPQVFKGKTKQGSPDTSDVDLRKSGKTTSLKQRLGTMRRRSGQTRSDDKQRDSTKRGKVGQAAALLFIPCITLSQRVKQRKNTQASEENIPEKKRFNFKDRLAARKAGKSKRESQQDPGLSSGIVADAPTNGHSGQPSEGETVNGTERKKSRAGILGGLTTAVMGIKAASRRKERHHNDNPSCDPEKPAKARNIAFSALKQRVKALRIKVTKIRRKLNIGSRLRNLKQKRKVKSEAKTEEAPAPDREVNGTKAHSAIAGLVAGCLALPGAKVKEIREKRRSNKPSTEGDVAANMSTSAMSEQPNNTAPVGGSLATEGGLTHQPPVPIPDEDAGETSAEQHTGPQYLPGHGQSEIPVAPERPRPRNGLENSVDQSRAEEPQVSGEQLAPPPNTSSAAAERFKSLRNGMSNLTTRTRDGEAHHASAEVVTNGNDAGEAGLNSPLAPPGGRFEAFKHFRGKGGRALQGQGEESSHDNLTRAAAGNEETAVGEDSAVLKTKAQTLRDGLGNLSFKRKGEPRGGEPVVVKDKQYKDRQPGFVERMRWIWYMS